MSLFDGGRNRPEIHEVWNAMWDTMPFLPTSASAWLQADKTSCRVYGDLGHCVKLDKMGSHCATAVSVLYATLNMADDRVRCLTLVYIVQYTMLLCVFV